jgi:hypothetical protein
MIDSKHNHQGWRRRLAIVTAIVVFITPWALYCKYLIKGPLNPVNGVFHMFWSAKSEGAFNKSVDIRTVARILTGKREKLVFEFPETITFKRLRFDPMERIFGVVTFYEIRAYGADGKMVQHIVFDGKTTDWSCSDCNPGETRSGWELATFGALAVASPVLPDIKAAKIEIDLKAVPLHEVIGFPSWLSEKFF